MAEVPEEKLLPCPFCDNPARLIEGHRDHWIVECIHCCARTGAFEAREGAKARAAEHWNRRADRLTRQDPDIRRADGDVRNQHTPSDIRRAALEERKDRERQIRVSEYRRAVEFLHKQADRMNDLHARAVLNLAADELGRARSRALKEVGM